MAQGRIKKYRLAVALGIGALALSLPAHAAETTASENIGTMTVSAPPLDDAQLSNNVTVLAGEDFLPLRPAVSDTAGLLKNMPGVSLYNAGGVSSLPAIHGLADDRLRIKVDGMDLISACANHMNSPLSYIDPTNVESAAVFSGITPVSVGGDSIGGTILVDSQDPEFAKAGEGLLRKGEIGGFYRSNGNAFGGNATATVASEALSLSYRGSAANADNYTAGDDFKPAGLAAAGRDWLDGDEVGSSQYEATNHQLVLGLRKEIHLVELKVGLQEIPNQGFPNQRMDMTDNESTQLNLRYKGQYDWGGLEGRVYHEETQHEMQFADDKLYWYTLPVDGVPCTTPGSNCAAGMPMETEGHNTGAVLKTDIELSTRDLLRVGGEVQQYRLDDWWDPSGRGMWPNTFWNINDGERDRLALFGEWEAQWNPQWLSLFGVRGEQVDMDSGEVQGYSNTATYVADAAAFNAADRSKTDNNIDLSALARYTPHAQATIEFGYAQKTRSPNLYERYAWSTGGMAMRMVNMAGDGNGYVGNLALDPETAHTVSTTLDLHDAAQKRWGMKLTPFYTYIDDYIDAKRLSRADYPNVPVDNLTTQNAFTYLQFVNQSARLYGFDVSGHFPLVENTVAGDFIASGLLSYVRGDNDTTDDNLYNIMPLNAKLAVAQHLGAWKNTIEAELVDKKTDVSAVRNELATAGYALLHLRSSYEWKQLRLDLGIENLLDKFYDLPLGGAYTGQGKTMSATDVAWGTPVPGMGRSFYAGLTAKF